jgi:hypothetical protein
MVSYCITSVLDFVISSYSNLKMGDGGKTLNLLIAQAYFSFLMEAKWAPNKAINIWTVLLQVYYYFRKPIQAMSRFHASLLFYSLQIYFKALFTYNVRIPFIRLTVALACLLCHMATNSVGSCGCGLWITKMIAVWIASGIFITEWKLLSFQMIFPNLLVTLHLVNRIHKFRFFGSLTNWCITFV